MTLEKWLVSGPKTIDLELVRSLKISLIGGTIDIIGHDEPGARVEIHSVQGKDLKVSIDEDVLEIDHPQLRWDNFIDVFASFRGTAKADVSVLVPRNVALKFGVVSAGALISGLNTTEARISTVSGDIVIDQLTGTLELNTVNGEISVREHTGAITSHSVSGDVTVSGTVPRFTADSVSSHVFLDLVGNVDVLNNNTVSGDFTVRLDDGFGARFNVNTVTGVLSLDGSTFRSIRGRGNNFTSGALDAHFVEVHANSVSGDITSMRRVVVTA
ncbi:DUF4097 family beta strand repeat-containing protein [Subtercola boreus]|uniref:DUF4097 domain-containing protein n=1 Tax=Subtercola boreus TaxID=120213 RepID=A0A3E0WF31_9MICO|nr:DUF4097 family beta strand repeat-containing protein [Subtercola boreus]RFA22378.1 hypothetical protein B7R24_04335 [Subtercola boreus]RFA22440.1 hypothetical protein B7R23_04330 [Subtercola boreus]RFA28455.1 hypothetical protein B7R25_04345 [Subtercola boreus]